MKKFIVGVIAFALIGCAGSSGKSKVEFVDQHGNPVKIEQEFVAPPEKKESK
jgi:hypothetical protein